MKLGTLEFKPVEENLALVSDAARAKIEELNLKGILVAEIDDNFSDTATFCDNYQIQPADCVNCVIVEAKRGNRSWYAACLVPATMRADINGIVRRELDAKKISFASMDKAVSESKMEYGAITPVGLPSDWPILVESSVLDKDYVVIGSGVRSSKLLVPGKPLATLPNTRVLSLEKQI